MPSTSGSSGTKSDSSSCSPRRLTTSSLDPGYVKGYLPGVRENGGQYTHAAVWVMQAAALLGQGRLAFQLLQIINPILHAQDPAGVEHYRVEPYVLAGDVCSYPPHVGRGGWTWYTGSAGWFYQAILESILGFQRLGDRLVFQPCLPPEWSQYRDHLPFPVGDLRDHRGKPNRG